MDDKRFDDLIRMLGTGASRRSMLKGLLGLGGAAVAGEFHAGNVDARPQGTRPTIPPPPLPPTTTTTTAAPTTTTTDPCTGFHCGLDCCDTEAQCCDGECCPAETVCLVRVFGEGPFVEEEVCCPVELTCSTAGGDGICCDGACFDPEGGGVGPAQVLSPDLTCCPAGGTVCAGGDESLCCIGETPNCCVTGEERSVVCLTDEQCCVDADCPGACSVCNQQTNTCEDADFRCTGPCEVCEQGQCISECLSTEECCVRRVETEDVSVCIDPTTQCCNPTDCAELNPGTERRCWFCRPNEGFTCDPVPNGDLCRGGGPEGVCCEGVCCDTGEVCQAVEGEAGIAQSASCIAPTTTTAAPTTTTTPVPTTTPCPDNGESCGYSTVCCSGFCVENACSATCGALGAHCQDGPSCCSGFCVDFVCAATCGAIGQFCGDAASCCDDGFCVNEACSATCGDVDQGCDDNASCCSGFCVDSFCAATCGAEDEGCDFDTECCSGICIEHECAAVCGAAGAHCHDETSCCSGSCIAAECQAPATTTTTVPCPPPDETDCGVATPGCACLSFELPPCQSSGCEGVCSVGSCRLACADSSDCADNPLDENSTCCRDDQGVLTCREGRVGCICDEDADCRAVELDNDCCNDGICGPCATSTTEPPTTTTEAPTTTTEKCLPDFEVCQSSPSCCSGGCHFTGPLALNCDGMEITGQFCCAAGATACVDDFCCCSQQCVNGFCVPVSTTTSTTTTTTPAPVTTTTTAAPMTTTTAGPTTTTQGPCTTDEQCGQDQVCCDSTCIEGECCVDEDCDVPSWDSNCVICEPVAGGGRFCFASGGPGNPPCPNNGQCCGGLCTETVSCGTAGECSVAGESCVESGCCEGLSCNHETLVCEVSCDPPCPPCLACNGAMCVPDCRAGGDCCEPEEPIPGNPCFDAICLADGSCQTVPNPGCCTDDSECGECEVCDDGECEFDCRAGEGCCSGGEICCTDFCTAPEECVCQSDAECGDCEVCEGDECEFDCRAGENCCGSGTVCCGSACVPPEECGCVSDQDCGACEFCNDQGFCSFDCRRDAEACCPQFSICCVGNCVAPVQCPVTTTTTTGTTAAPATTTTAVPDPCEGVICDSPPGQCFQTPGTCFGNGLCQYVGKPVGTECDDGNACTENDECNSSGTCVGTLIDCDDANECTDDACHFQTGCTHTPVTDGTACATGACLAGACAPTTTTTPQPTTTTCLPDGARCGRDVPCCNRNCGELFPESPLYCGCAANGERCAINDDCCEDTLCFAGFCGCFPNGAPCNTSFPEDCCGDVCTPGSGGTAICGCLPDLFACDPESPEHCCGGSCQPVNFSFRCVTTTPAPCEQNIAVCAAKTTSCNAYFCETGHPCADADGCVISTYPNDCACAFNAEVGHCEGGICVGGAGDPNVCKLSSSQPCQTNSDCFTGTCALDPIGIHLTCDGELLNCNFPPPPGALAAEACVPLSCAELGVACGTVVDNCGGEIDCGPCPEATTTTTAPAVATTPAPQCIPATSCAGQCGQIDDGCGGVLDCGACCLPRDFCQEGECGVVDDGCGGALDCGPCSTTPAQVTTPAPAACFAEGERCVSDEQCCAGLCRGRDCRDRGTKLCQVACTA